jgi:DNA segregation ATPase FtsK/SpoIIIE, S-DNA-T family
MGSGGSGSGKSPAKRPVKKAAKKAAKTSATSASRPASGSASKGAKTGGSGRASGSGGENGSRGAGGRRRRRGPLSRLGGFFGQHLRAQRQDVGGIALILLGVLFGLGTYADAAGPVGEFLQAMALGLLGLVGYAIPVLLAWLGLLIVIGRPSPEIGRIIVGSILLIAGLLGSIHLLAGSPQLGDGVRELWAAGGLVGVVIANPLRWALSVWGASAVLIAVIGLGALIVTRTPFSTVIEAVKRMFRPSADDAIVVDDDPDAASRARGTAPTRDDEPTEVVGRIRATLAGKEATQPSFDGIPADAPPPVTTDPAKRDPALADMPPPSVGAATAATGAKRKARKVAPVRSWDDYELPPLDLLSAGKLQGRESARTIEAQTAALQDTFHQFGIDAHVARWSRGPTVTRFEVELGPGVQVKKVANMGDDIAYALAAPDVRIVAPIPGKSAIGIEVPNRQRDLITVGDVLRSDEAQRDPHPMTVAIGVDIAGSPALVNLTTMPHLLVSGATGSGKSVTLNGMISSIIMRARPDQVRMILIDPKRVELNAYQGAPHLLSPVVTDPRRATDAVQWCVKEMEQRYELLAQLGYRNIDGYNDAVAAGEVPGRPGPPELGEDGAERATEIAAKPLPYILLVIDELADLMLIAPRDVEDAICRIAQMARAVGIHMIIATQRPSVDVITGLIKANIPSRLALAVASQTDSRTILDVNGAEKLVGKGDMLFQPASQGKAQRLQGCWVTEREITAVVGFCKAQREAEFEEQVVKEGSAAEQADAARSGDDGSDEALLRRAAEQVVVSGLGSTSMLQRKLRIGFARAGRLMDELEELGVVGPNEGSKARDVIWTPDELDDARSRGVL